MFNPHEVKLGLSGRLRDPLTDETLPHVTAKPLTPGSLADRRYLKRELRVYLHLEHVGTVKYGVKHPISL